MTQRFPGWLSVIMLWVAIALIVTPVSFARAQSVSDPLVLAFYYTWFDENTWNYDTLSDLPAEPYVSRDRGVMGRHIDQAKAAGIDGFIVAWYGPNGNQTETNLSALLEEATVRDFRISILFESDSHFLGGDLTGALSHALNVHANQPAYLRADGKPVIFFWRPAIYGVETWRSVRAAVDPEYGSLWINEGVDTSFLAVFDGHYLYSNTWNPPADLAYTNQKFATRVATARTTFAAYKLWVATVMPGYNDAKIRPNSGFAKDREGGAYYQRAWAAAIASGPNWVVITSFNEWPEGSHIEPSAAFGDQYIGLTAAGSQQFKSSGGQAVSSAAILPPQPVAPQSSEPQPTATATETETKIATPTPVATPSFPAIQVVNPAGLNLRSGPGIEFPILTILADGSLAPIVGRDPTLVDWWQIAAEGQLGWVNAQFVQALGPLDQVTAVTFVAPAVVLPTPTLTPISISLQVVALSLQTASIARMPPPAPVDVWLENQFLRWNQ